MGEFACFPRCRVSMENPGPGSREISEIRHGKGGGGGRKQILMDRGGIVGSLWDGPSFSTFSTDFKAWHRVATEYEMPEFSHHQHILPCIHRCSSEVACFLQYLCIIKKKKVISQHIHVHLEIPYQAVQENCFTTDNTNVLCSEKLINFALVLTLFTIVIFLLFKDYCNLPSAPLRLLLLRSGNCFAMCGQPVYLTGLWKWGTFHLCCWILQD